MSAEVVVKKRGRPKKIIADVEIEEVEEAPKKSTTRKTKTAATAKKTLSAKKTVKAEELKPSLQQESQLLEELKKLELSKGKKNPTTKPSATSVHSSSTPTKIPAQTSTAPITSESSSAQEIPNASTSTSKILNEVRTLSKKTNLVDKGSAKETTGKTTSESSIEAVIESTTVADTPLKNAAAPRTTISNTEEPTMAKPKREQPSPIKSTSHMAQLQEQSKPKIPVAALNSKIVSDISARGGARISPSAGGAGKLHPNYKPIAKTVTRTIIALPILIVTSYVLYERLVRGEEQKQLIPLPAILSGKKEEGSKDVKPTSSTA